MASWQNWGRMTWPVLLLVSAGCTISVQPWTKPTPTTGHRGPCCRSLAIRDSKEPDAHAVSSRLSAHGVSAYRLSTQLSTQYGRANESVSQLIKQLNETDDQRKALLDQVQNLKKIARERDDNLQHASYEMDESTKQLKRTREEVRQFGAEMDDLRERLRKLEEMRTALKPLMDEMMYHLEREKEAKAPRPPTSAK